MSAVVSRLVVSPSRLIGSGPRPGGRVGERDDAVAHQLLDFLSTPGLAFRTPPVPLTGGWETYTYGLEFEPRPGLAPSLRGPLVLRVYASGGAASRARHEFAALAFAYQRGFPVPRPLLQIEDDEPFGGPAMLLQRLSGRPVLDTIRAFPWRLWDLPAGMAELHVRLHQMSPEGFPDAGDFLGRKLDEIRARVVAYGLEGLRPGLDWLADNRPTRTGTPRPLHLDWHPLNVLDCPDGLYALDWAESAVGDRHADVAVALMTLRCLPAPPPACWQRPFVPLVRKIFAARYLRVYHRLLPLDQRRLTYYGALAALNRLARYGRWRSVGAANTGCKPSALRYASREQCEVLGSYFARHSGVRVKLECDGW